MRWWHTINRWKLLGTTLLLLILLPSAASLNGSILIEQGAILLAVQVVALCLFVIGRRRNRHALDWMVIGITGWFLYPWVPYSIAKVANVVGAG